MKETTQNNILLAKFLGWEEQTDPTERWFGAFRTLEGIVHKNTNVEPLLFHNDWNWLMPVVHRCLLIAYNEMLHEWENSFADVFLSASIDIMYKETVDFVKWYNEHKSK